ncbi:spore germination protein [Bacillus paralicheniformis]|jgi:spore germination protein AA|uniref:spore germination protein n=3 Tax=Bacillus paralicheniformis TaxID=1648923 RepID=UPI0003424900|nr:spore germination protein [Bacillus paralicheniformis]ETB71508.1 spore germination protein [Bacillus sp. CPSM8]KUL13658.1 spore germination protein [Bacillus licheniformis LMG 7559]AGN37866.1 spore germination protein GerAA [Bacillus paralicheniformis ATCC 9945a]ARA87159.1 spore germination protein [Bacillus paralicheniformis]AYQ17934.1 spore germination protein [Bacillus paralicheniformis]
MTQSEFKEHIHENLAILLPHLEHNDDLIQNKKMLKNGIIFYFLYFKDLNDDKKIQKAAKLLVSDDSSYSLEDVRLRLNKLNAEPVTKEKDAINAIFKGKCLLLINGMNVIFALPTSEKKKRSLGVVDTENVVRGPKIGFIEDVDTNVALVRQRVPDQELTVEKIPLGKSKFKDATILYIQGKADDSIIKDLKKRLKKVQLDDIQDTGVLEELIEDNKYSPFPQIQNTERPDKVSSALFNGRIAIFVDYSPFALIVPASFGMVMQSPDDFYERWIATTLIRFLRFSSIFITLFLSAFYISLVSFHQGMLPTALAVTIASTRENVPFPPLLEALIMEVTIELLREAGLRLPNPLGQTIGLVGGVVIGQAAVEANIVSSVMVIIVSIIALASFTVPQYGMGLSFRVLRFISMVAAAVFGLYGIILCMLAIFTHLVRQRSFGIPYFNPNHFFSLKHTDEAIIRLPTKAREVNRKNGSKKSARSD